MLNATKTITVINAEVSAGNHVYHAATIEGVSFCKEAKTSVGSTGTTPVSRYIVRVPEERCKAYLPPADWRNCPDGHWTVQPDCYVVCGKLTLGDTAILPQDLDGFDFFVVSAWRDSRGLPLGHIRLEGSR